MSSEFPTEGAMQDQHCMRPVGKELPHVPITSDPRLHPEWRGSIPSKWMDRGSNLVCSRHIVETTVRNGKPDSLARMGFGPFMDDKKGLDRVEGRKYIEPPQYPEAVWRPSCNKYEEKCGQYDAPPEGVKRIEPMEGQRPAMRREKRHIRQLESHQEFYDVPESKHIVQCIGPDGETQLKRGDKTAHETTLEAAMQKKRPMPETLDELRNGIGVRALGDKQYKHPEYSDRFFYNNELIIGSGFVRGSYQKTRSRQSTEIDPSVLNSKPGQRRKTYAELEAMRKQARYEAASFSLVDWEKTVLKEELPDYVEPSDSDEEREKPQEGEAG